MCIVFQQQTKLPSGEDECWRNSLVLAAPVVQDWKAEDVRKRLERPQGLIHFKMYKATKWHLWHLHPLLSDNFHPIFKDDFKLTGMSVLLCHESKGCLWYLEHLWTGLLAILCLSFLMMDRNVDSPFRMYFGIIYCNTTRHL